MNREHVKQIMQSWDSELDDALKESLEKREARRHFLLQSLVLPMVITPVTALASISSRQAAIEYHTDHRWNIIEAVHDILFPADNKSPGAKEIHATIYLNNIMSHPGMDVEEKNFILKGTGWLDDISKSVYQNDFTKLTASQKEAVLRLVSKSDAGDRWLSLLLLYIFEALLSDPVYGGNTEQAGWKWLQHKPGFPRPPLNKRYFDLL